MIVRREITEEQARAAIEAGEFSTELIYSSKFVALILTQDWCPQWLSMLDWLKACVKKGKPEDVDIDVYELIYNNTPLQRDFMRFKENELNNYEIPYVRYYVDGSFIGDSNYVSRADFVNRFKT